MKKVLFAVCISLSVICTAQNVGIGTNSPVEKLDVIGKIRTTNFQMTASPTLNFVLTSDANGNATWQNPNNLVTDNDNQTLTFSNPNLSISGGNSVNLSGLNTDAQTLSLSGTTLSINGGNSVNLSSIGGSDDQTIDEVLQQGNTTGRTILFDNTNYDGLYFGQVFTDAAAHSGAWAYVRHHANNGQLEIGSDQYIDFYETDGRTLAIRMDMNSSGMAIGSSTLSGYKLYVNGRVRSNGINETSDARFKKNINTISSSLEKVLQLRGVTYQWRQDEFPQQEFDTGEQLGLIAQEVETVIPQVVHTDDDGYKSVQYSNLVALLIEGMKSQQQQIDALQAEVKSLNSIISSQASTNTDK